ncbi:MAG: ATP-binding cassette, subfamily bacterial [Actinomycetota bacterium]|nr:ATP-binding cassette, subfamily bacterial [Actinomycetota bacterium]
MLRLLRVFDAIDRRLTTTVFVVGAVQGLLLPAFTVASGWLAGSVTTHGSVTPPLIAIGVIWTVQRLLDPLNDELGNMLFRKVDEGLTQRVMRAIAEPPGLAHVEDPRTLDAAAQAEGALTGTTPGLAARYFSYLVKRRVWGACSLLIVMTFKWWLVPLLLVAYAVGFRFTRWHYYEVTIVMHGKTERLRRAYYLRTLALTHTVAKETRVFGLAPWFVDRYRSSWTDVMQDVWDKRREGWARITSVAALLAITEGYALSVVARDAAHGQLSVRAAVTVAQALVAAAALAEFTDFHWAINESLVALEKLEELETTAHDAIDALHGDRTAGDLPTKTITFEGVRFGYPTRDTLVFDGLDLEIEVGRSLAIVGENGAGKTTFVKLLARLYDPIGGRILVDGVDLRELDPTSWRQRIAPVFQDYTQFELPAYDNVAFGALRNRDDADGVHWAGTLTGATAVIERLADGWDTPLSRAFTGGTQLSGGEWQRLALARAMFAVRSGAPILILDEPTAAMDVRGEAEVYERFLELTKGVTTIVISHRFSTVRRADRIVVVEHGRVVEDGTHDELVAHGQRYAEMYALQASRFQDASNS